MNCATDEFPTLRHIELRDFTAAVTYVGGVSQCGNRASVATDSLERFSIMPQLMWRMRHAWMLAHKAFGVIVISGLF